MRNETRSFAKVVGKFKSNDVTSQANILEEASGKLQSSFGTEVSMHLRKRNGQ